MLASLLEINSKIMKDIVFKTDEITSGSPGFYFNSEKKYFCLFGQSRPIDVRKYYDLIIEKIITIANENKNKTYKFYFIFWLGYFNSSSANFILFIITNITKWFRSHEIVWIYDNGDDDMMEVGQELKDYCYSGQSECFKISSPDCKWYHTLMNDNLFRKANKNTSIEIHKGKIYEELPMIDTIIIPVFDHHTFSFGIKSELFEKIGEKYRTEYLKQNLEDDLIFIDNKEIYDKRIIHIKCPSWEANNDKMEKLLTQAYDNVLKYAHEINDIKSIGFFPLGLDVNTFPPFFAAKIAKNAISNFVENYTGFDKISIICPNDHIEKAFKIENIEEQFFYLDIECKKLQKYNLINQKMIKELNQLKQDLESNLIYAKGIQRILFPQDKKLKEFLKDYFILYEPKDIVSGDFYWAYKFNNIAYLAIGDCTGHGVTGALLSIISIKTLNEIIDKGTEINSDIVLDKLRDEIIKILNPEENSISDGMDIALCRIDIKMKTIQFSGANIPLLMIRDNEIIEFKASKQPIGLFVENQLFENTLINYQSNDKFYLCTDGYKDQKVRSRTRIGSKNFKEILLKVALLDFQNQKERLWENLTNWMGDKEQIDDITIIGFSL